MTETLAQHPTLNKFPSGIPHTTDLLVRRLYDADPDCQGDCTPLAVVNPRSTDEIVALLAWANATGTGVVPVSSRGRRRRGDTVPVADGAVIADLSAMRQLIHVDAREKIAIVEPGLSFGCIDDLLAPHGLRALRPLAPRAGKSLVTSYLEREPLIHANEHWDVADPFGATAVVLGNGKYAPTGSAAIAGTLAEQLARGHRHLMPVGPVNLDILRVLQGAQGTLGIMAWAAVFCERIPSAEQGWFASSSRIGDVLDFARTLLHRRLGNALFVVDRVQLAMLLQNGEAGAAAGAAGHARLADSLPAWTAFVSLAAGRQAPAQKMQWQSADLQACAAAHDLRLAAGLAGHAGDDLVRRLHTSGDDAFRDRPHGAHRELFFLQQLHQVERYCAIVRETVFANGFGAARLGVYVQPMAQGVYAHIEFTLTYDPRCPEEAQRSAAAMREAARICAEHGAFFSRPYGAWAELAYARDKGIGPLMAMTKQTFDPNRIMQPGRLPY